MADIKKLLNKKGWTGRELGIIELTNMCSVFKQSLEGVYPVVPLVEKAQFRKMLTSITDSYQDRIYNGYIAIHEWVNLHYNIRHAHEQQAQLRYKDLIDLVEMAIMAEDVYKYESKLPVIMTQKQYEETAARGRQLWLRGEEDDPSCYVDNLAQMILRAVEYYSNLLVSDPKKPNPLKPVRKKYVSEPIKSALIRAEYNRAADNGYWMTEDGKRSDQMTEAEWQKAITTPKMARLLEQIDLEERQTATSPTAEDISLERAQAIADLVYSGMEYSDVIEAEKLKDLEDGLAVKTFRYYYEEIPEDLSKWDVITDHCTMTDIYIELLDSTNPDPDEYATELRDFYEEFQEIIRVILQDIDEKWFNGEAGLVDLPLEKWEDFTFTGTEQYERDLYGFRASIDYPGILFDDNWKAVSQGIAILREDMIDKSHIDDRGYYIPPEIHHSFSKHGLESFFSESEHFADNLDSLESGREILLESYYILKAINLAIDMIADYYEVPDLEVFKSNTGNIEKMIDAINDLVKVLYLNIYATQNYHDEELKERKLQVLREIFTPIDWKSVQIPEATIEEARATLKDFRAFRDNSLSDILLWRKPAAEREEADLHE